ncbi:hypothetical protein [Paraflavitalea pollutisoli]|uniref:hypothetical protein n=1 Tax=Paraflavitalea pollutisoli TaxID=3034143 RepID=UPI0023EC4AB1|nr:hypothetical protein [Paraflavitalea sp. H1-2-19X]
MKRSLLLLALLASLLSQAQSITAARFVLTPRADNFRTIELELNGALLVGLTGHGALQYVTTLEGEPLPAAECATLIKYYDQFDIHDIPGRVKSVGDVKITYNNTFDIHDVKGSLKSVGDIAVKYYNTFDIHDPQGKVKSVGNVTIRYYNSFDPDALQGRTKSIEGNSDQLLVWTHRGPLVNAAW